jgi:hypothetical protein
VKHHPAITTLQQPATTNTLTHSLKSGYVQGGGGGDDDEHPLFTVVRSGNGKCVNQHRATSPAGPETNPSLSPSPLQEPPTQTKKKGPAATIMAGDCFAYLFFPPHFPLGISQHFQSPPEWKGKRYSDTIFGFGRMTIEGPHPSLIGPPPLLFVFLSLSFSFSLLLPLVQVLLGPWYRK